MTDLFTYLVKNFEIEKLNEIALKFYIQILIAFVYALCLAMKYFVVVDSTINLSGNSYDA